MTDIEFVWWGLQSHFMVKPNLVLRLGWGFDKNWEKTGGGKNDENSGHYVIASRSAAPTPTDWNAACSRPFAENSAIIF